MFSVWQNEHRFDLVLIRDDVTAFCIQIEVSRLAAKKVESVFMPLDVVQAQFVILEYQSPIPICNDQ